MAVTPDLGSPRAQLRSAEVGCDRSGAPYQQRRRVAVSTRPTASLTVRSISYAVDVVSLNITVTDPAGRHVVDLDQPDFAVFEDGVQQEVAFFSRQKRPIALSPLLDSSASMEQQLSTLQHAATQFIERLNSSDLAQIVDFDSRVEIRQPFTANQVDLATAIRRTAAGGSTSLYNAIYIALRELGKIRALIEEDIRRQARIVFSDGEDTSSLVSFDEVLDVAKRSETAIYDCSARP